MATHKEKTEKLKLSEIDDNVLELFDIKKRLGKGAYGVVWKAVDKKTSEVVAVKKIFDAFRDETDAQRTFREIIFLNAFRNHVNVVNLLNVHRARNDLDIYLVFEYMESDLHNIIKKGTVLKDVHKRYVMYQLINAVRYIHSGNVIHRDLKPSNILIDSKCKIKLADFGLARSVANHSVSRDASDTALNAHDLAKEPLLTDYVATRWYRAPEILIASKRYTKGIDMWSLGCILGEMLRCKALFPGTSTINQIEKIVNALPTITQKDIDSVGQGFGTVLLSKPFQMSRKTSVAELIGPGPADGINLVEGLLKLDPMARLTASAALMHPYVHQFHNKDAELVLNVDILPPFRDDVRLSVAEYRAKLYEMVHIPPNSADIAALRAARTRDQHKQDRLKFRPQAYNSKPQLIKPKSRCDQNISSINLPKSNSMDISKSTQPNKASKIADQSPSNKLKNVPSRSSYSTDKRNPTLAKSSSSLDSNKSSSFESKDKSPTLANRSTINGPQAQNTLNLHYYNKNFKMADSKTLTDNKSHRFGSNVGTNADAKVKPSIAAFQEQISQAPICRIPTEKKSTATLSNHARNSATQQNEATDSVQMAQERSKKQKRSPSPHVIRCYEKRLLRLEEQIKLYQKDVFVYCKENMEEFPTAYEEDSPQNINLGERVKNMLRTQSMDRKHNGRSMTENNSDTSIHLKNTKSVPKVEKCNRNCSEDCTRNQRSTSVEKLNRKKHSYVPLSTNDKEIEALTYAAGLRGSGDHIGHQRTGSLGVSGESSLRSHVCNSSSSHYCLQPHDQASGGNNYRGRLIPASK